MLETQSLIDKAANLIEAMPYIQDFRGAIVVVKFGGSAMEDPVLIESVLRDCVLMECIGMKVVIVHGGGKAINAKLEAIGVPIKKTMGMRHTCEQTIKVVDDVLHNTINAHLVRTLVELRGRPARISGKDILRAEKMYVTDPKSGESLDIGFVGDVTAVDTQSILESLLRGDMPVIAPLALDENSQPFNINADIAAAKIAKALKARKLVYLSDVPGLLRDVKDESSLISTIRISEVEALISAGIIDGGMLPKIQTAVEALQAGCRKVHMIDGRLKHSLLLEMFTDRGVGTEIVHG